VDGEGDGDEVEVEDEDAYPEDADPLEASADSAHSFTDADAFPDSPMKLLDCSICGRRFREEVLSRHAQSCSRNQKKRKPLDMRAKRMDAEARDLALNAKMESRKSTAAKGGSGGGGGGGSAGASGGAGKDWKRESEALRDAIRNAREVTTAIKEGGPLPAYQPSGPDPSLIPCPHCGRRFNKKAADRHIPQCKNIIARPSRLSAGSGRGIGTPTSKVGNRDAGKFF
jgi:hypothetical protein